MQVAWVNGLTLLGHPRAKSSRCLPLRSRSNVHRRHSLSLAPDIDHIDNVKSGKHSIDQPLGPPNGNRFGPSRWGEGIRDDFIRRAPCYVADWRDGMNPKAVPTVLFLYCACLAPAVAFGGLTSALTGGSIGVAEFLMASGGVGMLYSISSGQPLTFLAPTGLTLAFTVALYNFCVLFEFPFLLAYSWVGIWTSLFLILLAICNGSDIIRFCTSFTDDIFNSLIATNFIYEATRSLVKPFTDCPVDKTSPYTGLALALGTFFVSRILSGLRSSRYLWKSARTVLSDFGPILAVISMSVVAALPAVSTVGIHMLQIPASFSLAGGRSLIIPIFTAPLTVRLLSIVPAVLLTCLFFLDQNISVRVVNAPQRMLQKGPGYHLDMLSLSVCTAACAVFAMPFMCAGTVQSLAHVRALSNFERIDGEEVVVGVIENRLTAFVIHALIFCSVLLLPIVQLIPLSVVSGLFLFLGVQMFDGNLFLHRVPLLVMDPNQYPQLMDQIPARDVHMYTLLQLCCLSLLWALKLNKKTSMFFPAVIGCLMVIRSFLAPRIFSERSLAYLDSGVSCEDVRK